MEIPQLSPCSAPILRSKSLPTYSTGNIAMDGNLSDSIKLSRRTTNSRLASIGVYPIQIPDRS